MRSRVLLSPLVVVLVAFLVSAGTFAKYRATTGSAANSVDAGSVNLTDNDSGSSMLGITNGGSGASDTSCIRVTSNGSLPAAVRLQAASTGALASHLAVRITRGSGAAGFDDCTGFTADERDYYGLGNGVLSNGRLSDLPGQYTTGVSDPSDWLMATSSAPLMAARAGIVGMWELGDKTRNVDNFEGTTNALLTTRPGLMAAWTRQTVSTTNLIFNANGRVRAQNTGMALYRTTGTTVAEIASADVMVQSASGEAGIMTRMPTTGDSGYLVRYRADVGIWELAVMNAGVATVLDSWTHTVPNRTISHVAIDQSGTSTNVYIDGNPRLSATDATFAAAGSGRTGIRIVSSGQNDDNSGVQMDNFRSITPNLALNSAPSYGSTPTTIAGTTLATLSSNTSPSPTDQLYSASFNGTTQALGLPLASAIGTTATIGGWFKLTSGDVLMRDSTTGATAGWSLGFDDGSGTMKFRVSGEVFDTGVQFDDLRGNWHHHALVRNGSAVEYYLDGRRVFAGTVAATTAPVSPFILMRDGTAAPFSAGRVDQVGIWNRALTADEIASIRDAVSAPADWQQGESHWYKIDVTVDEDPAAASSTATGTFTWEAHTR